MALRIFISHSHNDAAWCDRFVGQLASYDMDIWYDRQGLYAGSQWLRTIEDELMTRDLFLVVLTPESWASDWVREELALALAAKKRIIGVMMQQTAVSGFILQRQMISVVGQDAATAAQTVAASLGMQVRVQAEQPQAPLPPGATPWIPDLAGEWKEVGKFFLPYRLYIAQNGQILTGTAAGGQMQLVPITGHISGEEITIEFDFGFEHHIFRLRFVEGNLVGKRWASGFAPHDGENVALERR